MAPRIHGNLKRSISNFYSSYAPDKINEIDTVLEHFRGREDDLVKTLEKKYDVEFRSDGSFISTADEGSSEYETNSDEYDEDVVREAERQHKFSHQDEKGKARDLAAAAAAMIRSKPKKLNSRLSEDRKKLKEKEDVSRTQPWKNARASVQPVPLSKPKRQSKRASKKSGESTISKNKHVERVGTNVWVPDVDEAWMSGTVTEVKDMNIIRVKLEGRRGTEEFRSDDVEPMLSAKQHLLEVEDLTNLPALHEPALLQALHDRFNDDRIYTFTGPILLAVNPFKQVDLYSAKQARKYMESSIGFRSKKSGGLESVNLPPHVYKLADDAYRSMRDFNGKNQSILVSGESGAGKTETTKIALNYLSLVSQSHKSGENTANVSSRILQANPVLEAFGNAKTLRNDNSSRFGKLIQVEFDEKKGTIKGAFVDTYLLEKSRVVCQNPGERNYHIFYELASGSSSEQKQRWNFPKSLKNCNYTTGSSSRSDIDDLAQFQATLKAMRILNFSNADMDTVFKTVTAILHIGNIAFKEKQITGGLLATRITNASESLDVAAKLLQVSSSAMASVMTTRNLKIASEQVVKPLNHQEAMDARDALATTLYERMFGWIVWRTNLSIGMDEKQYAAVIAKQAQQQKYKERRARRGEKSDEEEEESELDEASNIKMSLNRAFAQVSSIVSKGKPTQEIAKDYLIGCLDIFGFEVFEFNSFEQLCINYSNETLQQQFNEFVFNAEQLEYEREGIDWTFVKFPENSKCIEMIEGKPIGLMTLVDEECLYPQGNDASLAKKLHSNLSKRFPDHFLISQSDRARLSFTVKHFAGKVTYYTDGFCVKNKNELQQEAVDLIRSSKCSLISILLPADSEKAAGGADMATHFNNMVKQPFVNKNNAHSGAMSRLVPAKSKLLKKTVSSHFKDQLSRAMGIITASEPHYVRCLKPNDENRPGKFHRKRMVEQLRYSGVLQVVKVTRAGYPSRFPLPQFVSKFAVLNSGLRSAARKAAEMVKRGDTKTLSKACEKICKNAGLEKGEDYQVGHTKMFLRQSALAILELKKAERIYDCVVKIQRMFRKFRAEYRGKNLKKIQSRKVRILQRNIRGWLIRKEVVHLLRAREHAALRIQASPHFQRWLDYIMRKSIAKRRAARRRRVRWRAPKWYTQNRHIFLWLSPLLGIYIIPTVLYFVWSYLYNNPFIPILIALITIGFFTGGLAVKRLGFGKKRQGVPARRKDSPPRTKNEVSEKKAEKPRKNSKFMKRGKSSSSSNTKTSSGTFRFRSKKK